ncbi:MAG: hypothetical protein QHH24_08045 [Candidatus Bathyarchaeota archaeon]|nr:hypothetical protein [Candidatus Bathyarchaeota archaeon]
MKTTEGAKHGSRHGRGNTLKATLHSSTEYYFCSACGYVADGKPLEACPVCGASKAKFQKIE